MAFYVAVLSLLIWAINSLASEGNCSTAEVDLGYEIHQGSYNVSVQWQFYNFSNIPYAQPPLGDLRFQAPVPFDTCNTTTPKLVNNGSRFSVCPQGIPAWTSVATKWLTDGIGSINQSAGYQPPNITTLPTVQYGTSEDCLVLDILSPKSIFESRGEGPGAAVLVWIHGGGYTLGWKTLYGSGAGLVRASESNGKEGVIYVALNYRLGLFGFLSGPTFQTNGTANAGLLDQRMALEWIQQNIAKFGGDPNRVTVMGESAGGGSTIHQITAYGGTRGPAPFQQAIIQSGAFLPVPTNKRKEDLFQRFLATANVSTLQEARKLPTYTLQLTNAIMVGEAPYGDFTFNPVVDGSFAPALPGPLLLDGQYDKSLKVVIGHNINEGIYFTSPFIPTEATFDQNVILVSFPNTNASNTLNYITQVLYPPVFNGTYNYTNQIERAAAIVGEALFACNANYLDRAFGQRAWSYEFSVPPSLHGDDVPYTFYQSPNSAVLNDTLAVEMQEYFTNFAITGDPNGVGLPDFPTYWSDGESGYTGGKVLDLNVSSIGVIPDVLANPRCYWWQKALYF
ncbi:Carboxylesterase [Lachnellula willkommii]|uniref:Carboxylic ester hydrolase n=1 Tax=Lachnellula willkommii TaxID=215461 RepID=A0A559MKB7_9HELO|nr:Carboxylesterase [Lachnellula willkommii]